MPPFLVSYRPTELKGFGVLGFRVEDRRTPPCTGLLSSCMGWPPRAYASPRAVGTGLHWLRAYASPRAVGTRFTLA